MRIKKKTEIPKRKKIVNERKVSYFCTLQEAVDYFHLENIPLKQVDICGSWEYDYFEWGELESEEDFNKRVKSYEKRLKAWEQWYIENEKAILEYENNKKEKSRLKLKKQIKQLSKRLENL